MDKMNVRELEKRIEQLLLEASQGELHSQGAPHTQDGKTSQGSKYPQPTKARRISVAIDGMSCSGKSMLASRLAEKFNGQVVHMDDFFLPQKLRTEQRLSAAGENVHYERFAEEVVPFLKNKKAFSYGKFCCGNMEIVGNIEIADKPLLIVEGAYCLRPEFQPYYDLKVCMTISPELQKIRLFQREGVTRANTFLSRWIPMENNYLEKFQITEASDILIEIVE